MREEGGMVRGFRAGEWLRTSNHRSGHPSWLGVTWMTSYTLMRHGPFTVTWSDGSRESGRYELGERIVERERQ